MKRGAEPVNIVFGKAVLRVDDKLVGLTKDSAKFTVEYEYRHIEAVGDRKKVKGRTVKEQAIPKIEFTHLELLSGFDTLHPGVTVDKTTKAGYTVIKGRPLDEEKDYHKIEIEGETKDGRECKCIIDQAINLENIDLEWKDKDDVVDKVIFEGVEDEESENDDDEGWTIQYKGGK